MGTILFLIFRLIKLVNTPYDAVMICLLVSLDSLVAIQIYKLVKK